MRQSATANALTPGTLLGKRYRIEEMIGSGGYASVYRAIDQDFGYERAIKEVSDVDAPVRKQFQLEAELLINSKHPNIPHGYALIEDRGKLYLIMEYIRGKDLEELLNESLVQRGRPLDEATVIRWMIDICSALVEIHAHRIPIIHRDIKPANIKITPEGRPVLIDFGLAKLQRAGSPTMTAAQGVSPGFAPPEQYMAKGRTDARTDIYGLGATLFACLTGKDPAEAPARLLAQTGIGTGGSTLVPPKRINPRISEGTNKTILRALELSPMTRQQTARQLRDELRMNLQALSGDSTGASAAIRVCSRCQTKNRPDATKCVTCGLALPEPGSKKRAAGGQNGATGTHVAAGPATNQSSGKRQAVGVGAGLGTSKQAAVGTNQHAAISDQPTARPAAAVLPRAPRGAAAKVAAAAAVADSMRPGFAPAAPDPWTTKHSAVAVNGRTGQQQALAAPPRTTKQQAAAPITNQMPASLDEKRKSKQAGKSRDEAMAGATAGALALAPATTSSPAVPGPKPLPNRGKQLAPARVSPRAAAAAQHQPKSWLDLGGDFNLGVFGKWILAFSTIEALWGAAIVALGVLVYVRRGQSLPLTQFGLVWLGILLVLSLIGGQMLSRPIYRKGKLTGLRRGFQGTGLFLVTIAVHALAVWGATVFGATSNPALATFAFILFGVNVFIIGILSVVNMLG